jgi:hypothetical protein
VDFEIAAQILINYSTFVRLERNWECNGIVYQSFTDFEKAYDSERRKLLHDILIEFGINMKLIKLIKNVFK